MLTAYWSLWVRVPAYILGGGVFLILALYCTGLIQDNLNVSGNKRDLRKGLILGVCVILCANAYFRAWQEENVLAAFAGWFVAVSIVWGAPPALAVLGYFVGKKVFKKTSQKWLGWVVGALIFISIGLVMHIVGRNIPEISWRMDKLFEKES